MAKDPAFSIRFVSGSSPDMFDAWVWLPSTEICINWRRLWCGTFFHRQKAKISPALGCFSFRVWGGLQCQSVSWSVAHCEDQDDLHQKSIFNQEDCSFGLYRFPTNASRFIAGHSPLADDPGAQRRFLVSCGEDRFNCHSFGAQICVHWRSWWFIQPMQQNHRFVLNFWIKRLSSISSVRNVPCTSQHLLQRPLLMPWLQLHVIMSHM